MKAEYLSESIKDAEELPQKPEPGTVFLFLCVYPLLWLVGYGWFQAAISWICSSLSINVFSPSMISLRISSCFISGALVMLYLCYSSYSVRRLILYMLPLWFVGYCFSGVTTGAINHALGFTVSRPINGSAPSASLHQGPGYYPSSCPADVNAAIASYLRAHGEGERYAPLVAGFICRLVVRDERGKLRSYRIESQEGFGTRLFVTQEGLKNSVPIVLSLKQVEEVREELVAIKGKASKKPVASLANCLYLEYQIAGQYYYVESRHGCELDNLEKMLVGSSVGTPQ